MTLPGFHECPECGGRGLSPAPCPDEATYRRRQMACAVAHFDTCPECGGAGQVPDDDTVEVLERWLIADMETDNWQMGVAMEPDGFMRAALLRYARHTQETK